MKKQIPINNGKISYVRSLVAAFVACGIVVVLAACTRPSKPTEIRALSDQEAADLWSQAESHAPVGKAVARKIPGANGTITVTTTQVYMLRMRGGGSNGLATVCGFSCIAPAGSGPESCVTSGCEPSGNGCTPASCGSCTMSQPCRVESTTGIFGGQLFIASSARGAKEIAQINRASALPPQ